VSSNVPDKIVPANTVPANTVPANTVNIAVAVFSA
jgi:hypothetical protein